MNHKHEIGWAYPTSPTAAKLGKSRTGCFYLSRGGSLTAYATYAEARAAAAGSEPGRWSFDHPANASFLSGAGLD